MIADTPRLRRFEAEYQRGFSRHWSSGLSRSKRGPGAPEKARVAVFHQECREDLRYWVDTDRKTALRALNLVEAILCVPFSGIGKPEPLKHLAAGVWSRRLTQEHRIVNLVSGDRIDFLQARYHY